MEYTRLGGTGETISVVGFGGWAIGGHGYGKADDSQSIRSIRKAMDLGINIFDTADVYGFGHSEEVLSKALETRIKDVVVATKFGVRWDGSGRTFRDCSVGYLAEALEGSLRRLRTDCIPLYQLHWHDGVTPIADVFEALIRYRDVGKVRHIGCSNIASSVIANAPFSSEVRSAQVRFGVGFPESRNELADFRARHDMSTLVYGVLMRGLLSGKYDGNTVFGERDTRGTDSAFRDDIERAAVILEGIRALSARYRKTPAQVAIRWALDEPFVSCAVVGIRSEWQAIENAGACGWSLSEEDRIYLSSLAGVAR